MGQGDRSEVILRMRWDLKLKELGHPIWSRRSLSLLHTHHRTQGAQYSQFYHWIIQPSWLRMPWSAPYASWALLGRPSPSTLDKRNNRTCVVKPTDHLLDETKIPTFAIVSQENLRQITHSPMWDLPDAFIIISCCKFNQWKTVSL